MAAPFVRRVAGACYITHAIELRGCHMRAARGEGTADMTTDGFKHITVNAPDEDDVVIQAGLPRHDGVPARDSAAAPEVEPAPAADAPVPDESAGADGGADAAERKARAAKPARRDARSRETTLADLEGEPMPLAQRIVIIAAIVCIIGALVYYFMFMR